MVLVPKFNVTHIEQVTTCALASQYWNDLADSKQHIYEGSSNILLKFQLVENFFKHPILIIAPKQGDNLAE